MKRWLPKKSDFKRVKDKKAVPAVPGLLYLEQSDGRVFALDKARDLHRAYSSAVLRKSGFWTRAYYLPVPRPRELVLLWAALNCEMLPARGHPPLAGFFQVVEDEVWSDA